MQIHLVINNIFIYIQVHSQLIEQLILWEKKEAIFVTSCSSVVKASEKRVQSVYVQGNNSLSLKNHCWFIIIIKVHNNNEIIIQQIMLLIHSYYLSTACVIFLIENLFSLLLQFPPSIFASLLALYVFPCLIDFFLVCLLTLSWAIPCLLSCLVVCFLLLALYVYLLALLLMCFRTPSKLSCYLALILALLCD
jgi:hypothetical protein